MISRENAARLIENLSFADHMGDISESLSKTSDAMMRIVLSMLTATPLERSMPNNPLGGSEGLKTSTDKLKSHIDDTKRLFEEEGISGIDDLRTKVFPRIVEYSVIELLQVRVPTDISRVNSILAQLRERGISAVWDKILPSVTAYTDKVCGLIFPRAYIQEGTTFALDMDYLSELVATKSAAVTVAPSAARETVASKKPAEAPYLPGLRRGFLSGGYSAKRPEKPEDHDKDPDTTDSPAPHIK